MASGKTANYGLSLWEATDQVVRLDFNSDNEKIDAGMAENKAAAAAAKETAENLAAVAFTPENLPFVVGTYTGNGAANRTISLGFTPKAVLLFPEHGRTYNSSGGKVYCYGGLIVIDHALQYSNIVAANIVEGGFQVHHLEQSSVCARTNESNEIYYYMAVK